MRLALAIASFVILIVHGIVFYNQFFHKWENYQTAYFDQARSLAKTDVEKVALEAQRPRIEQAIVTQFGDARVDRCSTCHIAADDPRPGYIFDDAVRTKAIDPEIGIPLAKLDWMQQQSVKNGDQPKLVDLAKVADGGPRKEALARVGN